MNQDWKRMMFKHSKVWVLVDSSQKPLEKDGRTIIKYQLEQKQEYRVNPKNLKEIGQDDTELQDTNEYEKQENGAVNIYTDGACSGNPGPAGIGVFMRFGDHEKKISQYIGKATNNIAELEAVKAGLLSVKKKNIPVRVYTDSTYLIGVLTFGWKPKKNIKLIQDIKKIAANFKDIKFIKVKGHSGNHGNETADALAREAIG